MNLLNRITGKSASNSLPSLPTTRSEDQHRERAERARSEMNLAHDAVMLDDAASVLATIRDHDRANRELPVSGATGGSVNRSIQIGDNTHYHYEQSTAKPAGIGTVGKLALGAALAAGTGGLGLGVWSALREPVTNTVEKLIPGVNSEFKPGETILE